jgi:tetratricopeptide (TPR) repeat protein
MRRGRNQVTMSAGNEGLRRPSPAMAVFRQAFLLQQQGKLTEAELLYFAVLQFDQEHFDSLHNLGLISLQLGRPDEAVERIREALCRNPNSAEAHSNFGNALIQLGHPDKAVAHFEKAIAIKPNFAEARNNLGNVLVQLNRLEQSVVQFERALELSRPNADPYLRASYNLGVSLQALDRQEEAIPHYARAIALNPDYAEAHNNLGNALMECGRPEEALAHYERSAVIRPKLAEAHNNIGVSLHALNREIEAIAQFTQALVLRPDYADAYGNLGIALESLGRITEATQAFEKAIELAPTAAKFYRCLFGCKKAVASDRQLSAMTELAQRMTSLAPAQQIELHFALGKAFADVEQYDLSFQHLIQGNALKRRQITYDEGPTLHMLDRIRAEFTAELMQSKKQLGNRSIEPIFIVGMPRSGSTLIEQILASHPRVFGAGELNDFDRAVTQLASGDSTRALSSDLIRTFTQEDLLGLGTRYLSGIRGIAPNAERITDKMPSNFRFAGLIHLALPNARIIHSRRDPIDTCVSCFSTLFTGGQPFAFELGELGRYYRAYERLMDHWRNVLPEGVMLEVRYEEVVNDFERQARRIVAHCGLTWNDACLAFYRTQRPIKTASAAQVYQPLYNSSVGRGDRYGDLLRPLLDELMG